MNQTQCNQLVSTGFNAWLFCGPISTRIKEEANELKIELTEKELTEVLEAINKLIKIQ